MRAGHSREEVGGVGLQRVEVLGADDGESHLFREVVVPVPAEQLAVHAGLVERLQRAGPEVVVRVAGWREGAAELPEAPGVGLQVLGVLRVDGVHLSRDTAHL